MGRKRVLKIPRSIKIKCPNCGKKNQIPFTKESIFILECRGCKNQISTPVMQCCLICMYSGKKCYAQSMIEARQKKLEVRFPEESPEKNPKILTRDDFWNNK